MTPPACQLSCTQVLQPLLPASRVDDSPETRLHHLPAQVVEFLPDGTVTERDETAESLGLEPRDVSLFQPRPAGLDSPQRATLTPRGPLILFRTEAASAVISAQRACVFPCR